MGNDMHLRDVVEGDLAVFLQHQFDTEANRMVGSVARSKDAFFAHWAKTAGDPATRRQTIVCGGQVVGYVGSFERFEKREVCYWLGREFWGKGLATSALAAFLKGEANRPLFARVAKHNIGSIRVLEKCGFVREGAERFSNTAGAEIDEFIFTLQA